MSSLEFHMRPLDSAHSARARDRFTIDALGIDGIVLMEHAGRAVADHAQRMVGHGVIVVVCGPGNNGGDGYVAARHLRGRGCGVVVLSTVEHTALHGDARQAAEFFIKSADVLAWRAPSGDAVLRVVSSSDDVRAVLAHERPALIIDALFGTGLSRPLEGSIGDIVRALADAFVPILSIDVPSGLPTDGTSPGGACLDADETITFAAKKIAHASEPGHAFSGRVSVVDIGLHQQPSTEDDAVRELCGLSSRDDVHSKRMRTTAHKGKHGHVGVALGVPPTEGAALLVGHAALRAGAGLVSLVGKHRAQAMPELMQRTGDDEGALLDGLTSLVLGPGFGNDDIAAARAHTLFAAADARRIPLVVDADALPHVLARAVAHPMVCTPHPGEAAALLDTDTREVQRDRIAAMRALIARYGGDGIVFVLKGACPLVYAHGLPMVVVEGGTPALAVAGSGDILAGLIGALLARGESPFDAACAGVFLHQQAGRALARQGPRGHFAHEIADALPPLLAALDDAALSGDADVRHTPSDARAFAAARTTWRSTP